MNPAIINILVWEKELEIQHQKHRSRRVGLRSVEPALQPRRKKLKRISGWIRRKQTCESS